ncbi:MAG: DUF378 domain-containing protein [Anaerofustis stercorihominis]|nr:DUF378 domain-containing protein [Anaerofustis stercorihominis]
MRILSRIAFALIIVGAVNWGLIGLFGLDVVALLFGGSSSLLSRIVYSLVGISAVVYIALSTMDIAPAA